MLTHISRGSDTSAADFVTGSMLARIIVSERVPAIGSSSRLSIPSSRMLIRSVPCQSGRTVWTTADAMLAEIGCGFAGRLTGPGGLSVTFTGTVRLTGPAATVMKHGETT